VNVYEECSSGIPLNVWDKFKEFHKNTLDLKIPWERKKILWERYIENEKNIFLTEKFSNPVEGDCSAF
jgi:hypothetical protein